MSLPLLELRPLTVTEYQQMGAMGLFAPDERVELLEGEIYTMPPIHAPHASGVTRLTRLLYRILGDSFTISAQNPIQLTENSAPQPDLMVARWRDDAYALAHPTPADVLLLIEVADSTVKSDRSYKIPLYAGAGIPEAWLVNLPARRVEIFAEPVNGVYQLAHVFQLGDIAQSHTLPEIQFRVSDILN